MSEQDRIDSTASGATEIFRMPSASSTVPDLMNSHPQLPSLTIVKGPQTGAVFELGQTEVSIGRDPNNTVFLNDMTVSRAHARMEIGPDQTGLATIEDLGSLNGTWVDGAIVNKAVLQDGSTIQIGTFRMIFHSKAPNRIDTGA